MRTDFDNKVYKIQIGKYITVTDLAQKMGVKGVDVVKELFKMGVMATINQNIDFDTAVLVAEELGYDVSLELAKCDCADGIEQEKCWHALDSQGDVRSASARTQRDCKNYFSPMYHTAYMPECRQVTAEDAERGHAAMCVGNTWLDSARELHKLGFRMKVTP